jgi:tetratricopeptide (TPR) repeat protein
MKARLVLLSAGLIFAVLAARAQMPGGKSKCTIRIDVVLATGGHAPPQLRVRLVKTTNGIAVGENLTNSTGTAEFSDVDPGQYHALVSGAGIERADSGSFEVSDWSVFLSQVVAVRTSGNAQGQPGAPAVSSAELSVPPKAAKEYDRGNEEMVHKNWAKAVQHFTKAIEIYPNFAAAYNNLGVCQGWLKRREQQREALQKAVSLDEHSVSALVNLGFMAMEDKNPVEAGGLLNRALTADPNNVEALCYLAEVEVDQGNFDQAIATAHKAHGLPHQQYAIVHYTAARAFERQGRVADEIAELQTFVQEAPQSPRAEKARQAIATLQSDNR